MVKARALSPESPPTPSAPKTLVEVLPDAVARQQVALAMTEGLTVLDHDGTIIWFNASASRLLKLSSDEMLGQMTTDQRWRYVDEHGFPIERHELPAMRCLATGRPVTNEIMGIEHAGQDRVWLNVSATPIVRNRRPAAIVTFRDVTHERLVRAELDQTIAEINRTLVQQHLPTTGRIRFGSAMTSMSAQSGIGGDFLGAHQIDEHRYGFFIGDVCGHGVRAAGISALARHTLNTAGMLLDDPSQVLSHLHDVLDREWPDTYVTAIYGYVDVDGDQRRVRLSIGGHPRPVMLGCAVAREVGCPDAIVGMIGNRRRTVDVIGVQPGDRLVLFTDGLVETRFDRADPVDLLRPIQPYTDPGDAAGWALDLSRSSMHWRDPDDDIAVLVVGFD